MLKNQQELLKLDPLDENIYIAGLIDHYIVRPAIIESYSLALFASSLEFRKTNRITFNEDEQHEIENLTNDKMTNEVLKSSP